MHVSPALTFLSPAARDELDAAVRVIATEVASLPSHVSQRSVERVTGLPGRDYLAAARAAAFETSKVRRLVLARTVDVISWIESHRRVLATSGDTDVDDLEAALASVGARRVG